MSMRTDDSGGRGESAAAESGGEDFLSALPDDLLIKILSFLPTHDVVSTSVLCSRWFNLWRSLPVLNTGDAQRWCAADSFSMSASNFPLLREHHLDDHMCTTESAPSFRRKESLLVRKVGPNPTSAGPNQVMEMPIYIIGGSKVVDEILERGTRMSRTAFNSCTGFDHPDARGFVQSGCRPHVGHFVPEEKEDYVIMLSLDLAEELENMEDIYQEIMRKELQVPRVKVDHLSRMLGSSVRKCRKIRQEIAGMGGSCQEIPEYFIR